MSDMPDLEQHYLAAGQPYDFDTAINRVRTARVSGTPTAAYLGPVSEILGGCYAVQLDTDEWTTAGRVLLLTASLLASNVLPAMTTDGLAHLLSYVGEQLVTNGEVAAGLDQITTPPGTKP